MIAAKTAHKAAFGGHKGIASDVEAPGLYHWCERLVLGTALCRRIFVRRLSWKVARGVTYFSVLCVWRIMSSRFVAL